MRVSRRITQLLASSIVILVGLGLLAAVIILSLGEQRFISTATHVTGTVTSFIGSGTGNSHSARPVVTFTTTDGREFTYTSDISSNPSPYTVGQKVDIYYDSANPNNVVLAGQTGIVYLIVGGVGALLTLIGIVVFFFGQVVSRRR